MKKVINLMLFLIISSTIIAGGFKGYEWGTSRDKIRSEMGEPVKETEDTDAYLGQTFAGLEGCMIIYSYNESGLFLGIVQTSKMEDYDEIKKLLMEKEIKPFMELFKDMSEPDNNDRLKPMDAYQRYLELESIYLKSNKKQTIKRELRRVRK